MRKKSAILRSIWAGFGLDSDRFWRENDVFGAEMNRF